MSIAEDIANMTAKFTEEKTKEVLSQMSLEEIAQVWSDAKDEHSAAAATPEEQNKKDKDFDERRKSLQEIVPPEKLQNQINEYIEGLANGTFSPADFSKIMEFCNDFNEEFKNDAVKNALETMKQRMDEKRVELENPVTLINDKLPTKLDIQELDSIVIEGDKEKISALEDKMQATGKSISFKGPEDKELGTVSFGENGITDITFANENNETVHYQLSADGKLTYLPEGAEQQAITQERTSALSENTKALKLAVSAQKIWKDFSKGELDKSVEKEVKVSEAGLQGKDSKKKTQVNEANDATKVDEGQENKDPLSPTKFNEEESQPKVHGEVDGDDKKDFPKPENELYWKEDDIIDTMFKEWFLAAANAATNWVVHQIEYCAAGIWNEFESAFDARKKLLDEIEQKNKPDNTAQFYDKIGKTSKKHTSDILDGYAGPKTDKNDNAKTDENGNIKYGRNATQTHKKLVEAIQSGNIDEAIAQNKLLQNLSEFGISPKAILTQGDPEKTVPFVMHMALMANKFTDDYACASTLNTQLKDPQTHKKEDPQAMYDQKQEEARRALMRKMAEYKNEHPDETPDKMMFSAIQMCCNDMKEAKKIAENDLKNKKYIERGKNPTRNEILEQYENLGKIPDTIPEHERREPENTERSEPEPTERKQPEPERNEPEPTERRQPEPQRNEQDKKPSTLADEAQKQSQTDEMLNLIRSGLDMEGADLEGREQNLQRRQQRINATKNMIMDGVHRDTIPYSLDEQKKLREQNRQTEFKIPLKRPDREM